jgi:hypothetical protein
MREQRLKLFTLALGIFTLAGSAAQASDILIIHGSSSQNVELGTIRRITFGDGNLLVKTSSSESEVSLSDITKITFGKNNDKPNDISQPAAKDLDIVVYAPSRDLVVIETQLSVQMITMYDLNGRILLRTNNTQVNIGSLTQGIYLLKISTPQGTVTKKFIKN